MKYIRICALFLCFFLLLLVPLVSHGTSADSVNSAGAVVLPDVTCLCPEFWAAAALCPAEATVAVGWILEAPTGWSILSLSVASSLAADMTVTLSPCGPGVRTVRILLDGSLPRSPDPRSILSIRLQKPSDEAGILRLSPMGDGLYYREPGGAVRSLPLPTVSVPVAPLPDEPPDTGASTDPDTPVESTAPETVSEADTESVTTDTRPSETAPPPPVARPATYAGYQVTPVQDGQYAVRFLFYAGDGVGGVPLLCFGGGSLLLEIHRSPTVTAHTPHGVQVYAADGGWLTYTYRGLLSDREYRFVCGDLEIFVREK